jgi:DNA-binding winged helix-turn-helix (wHTH) protein
VILKVVNRNLFSVLSNAVSSLPRSFRSVAIEWEIALVEAELKPADFVGFAESPSTFLVDANDMATISSIRSMQTDIQAFRSKNPNLPLVLAPVIFAVQEDADISRVDDFPDFMSDWIYAPVNVLELGQRIVSCLARKKVMAAHLHAGTVMLIPDTGSISFGGKTMHLSPSEFILAELFFNQFGTVISFDQLSLFFRSKGKSTEANNIRVAIYQLRLKLDMLTKSQIRLASIYRKGYCLRNDGGKGAPHWNLQYESRHVAADRNKEYRTQTV